MKEVDDMMAQFESSMKIGPQPDQDGSALSKRRGTSRSPSRRRSASPPRGRGYGRGGRGRGKARLDERPVLYKIYDGRVQGLKEFGAFVQLEGITGRMEGTFLLLDPFFPLLNFLSRLGAHIQYSGWCPRQLGGRPPPQGSTSQSQSNECGWNPHRPVNERR